MFLIGLVSVKKNKKIKLQANKFLVSLFIFIFGCTLLYVTVTYTKAGHIIGGVLALLFAIIIFRLLQARITLHKLKEGMTSNIAKILSKKYEFTMQLPPGWQTHPHSESEFFEWKNKEKIGEELRFSPLSLRMRTFINLWKEK